MKTDELSRLQLLPTEYAREHHVQHLIADYVICINDDVSLNSWIEDVTDAPEDYTDYTLDQLEHFLFTLTTGS